jgi:hypothetical protein
MLLLQHACKTAQLCRKLNIEAAVIGGRGRFAGVLRAFAGVSGPVGSELQDELSASPHERPTRTNEEINHRRGESHAPNR